LPLPPVTTTFFMGFYFAPFVLFAVKFSNPKS